MLEKVDFRRKTIQDKRGMLDNEKKISSPRKHNKMKCICT